MSKQASETAVTDQAEPLNQELSEKAVEIAKETMAGDLIAATIDELKAAPNVWQKMSQKQQQEVIERVTNRVQHNISQAVSIMASEARPVIRAKLAQVTVKDELKAVVLVSKHHPHRHEFIDSSSQEILVVLLNTEQFFGGVGELQADPDQPELRLEEKSEELETEPGEEEIKAEEDEFLKRAVEFVIGSKKASISALQRALKIGYNRSARLMEELQYRGIVSPPDHAGLRTVVVSEG